MDTVEAQKTFSDKNSFDYPLLADVDGSVAEAFGVRQAESEEDPVLRATFVIGTDRKVVRALEDDRSMEIHADEALSALRS
jgi:peroxiredoxin Q/BCP